MSVYSTQSNSTQHSTWQMKMSLVCGSKCLPTHRAEVTPLKDQSALQGVCVLVWQLGRQIKTHTHCRADWSFSGMTLPRWQLKGGPPRGRGSSRACAISSTASVPCSHELTHLLQTVVMLFAAIHAIEAKRIVHTRMCLDGQRKTPSSGLKVALAAVICCRFC